MSAYVPDIGLSSVKLSFHYSHLVLKCCLTSSQAHALKVWSPVQQSSRCGNCDVVELRALPSWMESSIYGFRVLTDLKGRALL